MTLWRKRTIIETAREAGLQEHIVFSKALEAFAELVRENALAEPGQERNFCPRCGKRTQDIHTCTPPKEHT